jgi:murein L,D-transpeptidase YafK
MKRAAAVAVAAALWVPLQARAADLDPETSLRAMQALQSGKADMVRHMPAGERVLLQATIALKQGQPDQALDYLKSGDDGHDPLVALLEAEAHRRSAVQAVARAGNYARNLQGPQQQLEEADLSPGLAEADVRLHAFVDRLDGVYGDPMDLLQLGPSVHSVFMVDKARSRMFVYERGKDGKFRRVADEYVVTGAKSGDKEKSGDARTPNGVYRFVKKLQGKGLEARYGPVAFPIDYPNELDRLHHKNGYGIWMHGYPEGVNRRPPRDTKGCFALPNSRLLAMADHVQLGHSWVIVGQDFTFNADAKRDALLASVKQAIDSWKRDWSSLDNEAYFSHYDPEFHAGRRNFTAWKAYKRRVNANKSFVKVELSDMSIVRDPSRWPEGEVVVVEFNQHYLSNNYEDRSRKRLYMARKGADAPWRILLEESVDK